MHIEKIVTGPIEENCYLVICRASRAAVLIDPGDDAGELLAAVNREGVSLSHILLTHAHFDHLSAVAAVQRATGAPVSLHRKERENLAHLALQTTFFGLPAPETFAVATWLEGDETIAFGAIRLQVLFTPGHTAGGICFHGHGHLFSGDLLFRNSVGRSDLPGGDHDQVLHSIRTVLFALPDETVVHPGHGADTTLAHEKRHNPFLH
jgi:glyoxylase-like metal-dependent hydrolase (beta-lactamase superfamily II)